MSQNPTMRSIAELFSTLHGGAFSHECAEEMQSLVRRVDETGKAGKLTITLDLKKAGGALSVDAKVTSKLPEPKADADLLWATVDGHLSLQNPAQRNLDLQQVGAPQKVIAG